MNGKDAEKRADDCWKIQKILYEAGSIKEGFEIGADALATFVFSQLDTPAERRIVIGMCIERLKIHQKNADKF